MEFPLTEPTSPRYLYINPKTNKVHVLMPIVSGTRIGLDNTCKSVSSLQEFFGESRDVHQKAIRDELTAYKKALKFDISLIAGESVLKTQKEERHAQINQYIESIDLVLTSHVLDAVRLGFPKYPAPLEAMMKAEEVNLHSMVLRPKEKDNFLRFVNPVFSVKRDDTGCFYQVLSKAYDGVTTLPGARERLCASVLALLKEQDNNFETIQRVLAEQTLTQIGASVDFYHTTKRKPITKAVIEETYTTTNLTTEDYINGLLGACALPLFDSLAESPFYTRENAEELSIITQFFLASVNIYCRAHAISLINFGAVLDDSKDLSDSIAGIVLSIDNGKSIEDALLDLVNNNKEAFGLSRELAPADRGEIKKKFTENYAQIKDSPHFDEFTLLDDTKPGPFISHQGSICLNFAEFVKTGFPILAPDYFETIRADFKALGGGVTPTNPSVHASIELSIEELLAKITDDAQLSAVLKKLPEALQREIMALPLIKKLQVPKFLLFVARGQQDEAKSLLETNPDAKFLLQTGEFTDYSGRTFNCTAFEYAYWAKDTHMCRMLIKQMDDETKSEMLKRCDAMEKDGLPYTQKGQSKKSRHFEFKPLIDALEDYVDGFDMRDWNARGVAWRNVGIPQRDLPAHAANEYCRPDRSFEPRPQFNEPSLPRVLTFYNWGTESVEPWFPLPVGENSGLGFDFAVLRGGAAVARALPGRFGSQRPAGACFDDLAAVSHLDEVRSADLKQLRKDLNVVAPEQSLGMF